MLTKEQRRANAMTHGMDGTKEYAAWCHIKQRCYNPNCEHFKHYGGIGITLCDEWLHDFTLFYKHIGPAPSRHHSIDRIKNNLGYQPGNVRWATRAQQSRNRSDSVYFTAFGETKVRADWAKDHRLACPRTAFEKRLQCGWSFERAFATPKTQFSGKPGKRTKPEEPKEKETK